MNYFDNPNSNNATNINSNIVNPDEKPISMNLFLMIIIIKIL